MGVEAAEGGGVTGGVMGVCGKLRRDEMVAEAIYVGGPCVLWRSMPSMLHPRDKRSNEDVWLSGLEGESPVRASMNSVSSTEVKVSSLGRYHFKVSAFQEKIERGSRRIG